MSTDMTAQPGGGIPLRVVVLAVAGVALVGGWAFVLWHHHFRVSASTVMLMLSWAAVLSTVYFLWRTADNADLDDEQDWWRPTGRLEELVREKRSLLKTIKETELDRDTGKLSKADADEIITRYRGRAIEVIKAIEAASSSEEQGGSDVRARIEREVRARLELDRAKKPKASKDKNDAKEKSA
jgi:hypothetical protein